MVHEGPAPRSWAEGGEWRITLEGQMEGVQHNVIVCLLLQKPRPVALGAQSHLQSRAGLPFHCPPFWTMRQFCTPNTGQRPCPAWRSLPVCLPVLPPLPGPPSLPFLWEKCCLSIKVRLKCSSLCLPWPYPLHISFIASAFIIVKRCEHALLFRTLYTSPATLLHTPQRWRLHLLATNNNHHFLSTYSVPDPGPFIHVLSSFFCLWNRHFVFIWCTSVKTDFSERLLSLCNATQLVSGAVVT